ncbi:cytochrome b [Pseudomonas frederiksbergensis]|uniref:cytochrome b n=1 Tax=Pseudomonas frederiksbergensis TaxID=104087 RepID=UPI000F475349|nr:cytochrome b/b6 domain-containing protein [Pseudomonas frederiksbergensis]RON58973.1 cytochrome b [Pseudomonas frederiksbergensis]
MTVIGYSKQRVWLHWLSAAVIVWALLSGFYVACFEVSAQLRRWVSIINVSLTTVFIPFFVWRLMLFLAYVRQVSLGSMAVMEGFALLVHTLIYLTVTVVLMTGVLTMDRPIDVFGLIEIAQPLSDPWLIALCVTVHIWACVVLGLLIVLHVSAVVFHECRGHRVLRRMSLRRAGHRLYNLHE